MARSRRSAAPRPAPRPTPRPAAAQRPAAPPPVQTAPAPPPMQPSGGGGVVGGIMGMVGQGLAFGTGSAVAHRAVDAVMGPRTVTHEHVTVPGAEGAAAPAAAPQAAPGGDACAYQAKAFADCVQQNGSEISKCQFYIDMLNDCKRNSGGMA